MSVSMENRCPPTRTSCCPLTGFNKSCNDQEESDTNLSNRMGESMTRACPLPNVTACLKEPGTRARECYAGPSTANCGVRDAV